MNERYERLKSMMEGDFSQFSALMDPFNFSGLTTAEIIFRVSNMTAFVMGLTIVSYVLLAGVLDSRRVKNSGHVSKSEPNDKLHQEDK